MSKKLDFGSGNVTYNELKNIDFDENINNQVEFLQEDLLQVQYRDGYILDVGWYPEFNETGKFIMQIIKNYDWEKPVLKKEAAFSEFQKNLAFCVQFVENLTNGSLSKIR